MSVFETIALIGGDDVAEPTSSLFTQRHSLDFHASGERYLKIETAALGGLKLSRVSSSGHTVELTEYDHLTYLLPRHGALDVTTRTGNFGARAGEAMVFSPNSRLTRATPGPRDRFQALALQVPAATLGVPFKAGRPAAEIHPLDCSLAAHGRSASERSLVGYLNYLELEFSRRTSSFHTSGVRASAAALVRDLFGQFVSDCLSFGARVSKHHGSDRERLKLAEQIMQQRFREPLSIVDIANELGISLRTLQIDFNRAHGRPPRDFLNGIRMRAVHARLSDPSENGSVADVAFDCGFTHLGRFAAAYRAKYGERPSTTQKRNRA